MNLHEAAETFRQRADAGEVINRKTGKPRSLSPTRQRVIISNVSTALSLAAGVAPRDVGSVHLEPYIATLAEIGRQRAEGGKDKPGNVAANVSLFLATVFGEYDRSDRHGYAKRQPLRPERILPDWQAMYDTTVALTEEDQKKRTFLGQLVAFHDLCLEHGIRDPHDVPDDFATVSGWAKAAGFSPGKFGIMATAFRTARLRMGDLSLPTFCQRVKPQERGLRSLPNLAELLRAAGCTDDPMGVAAQDAVRFLAPKIGAALDRHVADGQRRHRSPGWVDEQIGMANRSVAGMIRMGIDPRDITWPALFEQSIQVESASEEVDELVAEEVGDGYVATTGVSLLRAIVDEAAERSFRSSPLERIRPANEIEPPGGVPFYTTKVRQDVMYAYMLTRAVYGQGLAKAAPGRWDAIVHEYEALRKHMVEHNEGVRMKGQKDKERILLLWPQAVFLGLRALRVKVLEAEARKDAYFGKWDRHHTQTAKRLLREFDEALKQYILASVMLDDGLRIKNYAGAVARVHFQPEVVRDRAGRWVAFSRMGTHFRGYDSPDVALKVAKDENEGERHRRRTLTPGIVDHRLLFVFWTESRPRDLVRRGAIASVEDFDPDADTYAIFVAPRAGGKRKVRKTQIDERAKRTGRYTPDQLSTILGRVLHWMVCDLLKRPGVPAWNDPARTKEWRGLFAAHVTRTLLATYFGGLREQWVYACHVTDDSEYTLRRNYVKVRSAVVAKLHEDGIENPHHFDAVVDRMLAYRPGDNWDAFWAAFDSENPTAALDALRDVVPVDAPRKRARRAVRAHEGSAA